MVSKQCNAPNCTRFTKYQNGGVKGFCGSHGGVPKCLLEGCERIQKHTEGGQKGYCGAHGGVPRCSVDMCSSLEKYISGGIRGRCVLHGGVPVCSVEDCQSLQKFIVGGHRGFCGLHGGVPLCTEPNCKTRQKYSPGGTRGFCCAHGGMPSCSSCGVFSVKTIGDLCSYCNPESKRRQKTAEGLVKTMLTKDFPQLVIIHDRRLEQPSQSACGPSQHFRPDFLMQTPWGYLIIEVDEHQHSRYTKECEDKRMQDICLRLVDPVVFIRFNPHGFRTGDGIKIKRDASVGDGHDVLKETIEYLCERVPQSQLTIFRLFYNCNCTSKCDFVHLYYF